MSSSIINEMLQRDMLNKDNNIDMSEYNTEYPWTVIESYFKGQHLQRLVRHQLESYNNFVGYQINKTIEMFNPVHIKSEQDYDPSSGKYALEILVTFENFHIYRPQIHENNGATKLMFPQEARLRNFTYASSMTIDMNIKFIVKNGKNLENTQTFYKTLPQIHIGKLPIMLKSSICVLSQYKHVENNLTGECKYDTGGYFIINGSEKTVLGQERAAENKVYCFNVSKNNTKFLWSAEIKSVPDFKCISPKQINIMISSKNNGFGNPIYIQLPRVKQPIPLFVLFRAIGIISDREICEKILLDINDASNKDMLLGLQASIIDANTYLTQQESIKYITTYVMYTPINMDRETGIRKKHEFTLDILNNDLFPHCTTPQQKVYFLGYMTNKLLKVSLKMIKPDDRDSYLNKRIDLTGALLNNLFRNYFNKLVKDMEKQIIKEINTGSWKSNDDYQNIINMTNIYKIIKSTTIENGLKRALSTGDFGIKHTNTNKVGVAQVLNRLTYVSSLSHARRISTPTDKSGKLIPPRKLHNTSWGYLCLVGDVDVLLSNRIDTKKIKDIRDGNLVNTVNRETLLDEPSSMCNYFCKMPDKLFEITTISGRKIKATSDHPFLVKTNDGKYEMKKVCELQLNDKVIIRHTVIPIIDDNTTTILINSNDVLEHYRLELLEKNLLNVNIPTYKLKIIARLIGALNTDGNIGLTGDVNKEYYYSSFSVGEEYDVFQLDDDIRKLGLGGPSIRKRITKFEDKNNNRTTVYNTWEVSKDGSFAYLMYLLGGFVGKKTNMKREIPQWLIKSEQSVKREFLSGIQGGCGSRLSYQKNKKTFKPNLGMTCQTTHNDYLNDTIEYMGQIIKMFEDFEINSHLNTKKVNDQKSKVCIIFEKSAENLVRYSEVINYTYCEEKRRNSAPIIEHLKIRVYNKKQRDIIDNYSSKTDVIYENMIKENIVDNGCISVPILSINEIEPELVYDFTTTSENHSFVASSFVVSNCPAETPEGQSVGVVKNLSYMTHVTIPSDSSSIYEYIQPNILSINDFKPVEMYKKVKVFINGCWIGITDDPNNLYLTLKEKKYQGIINVYTSVIFDYKLAEIKICNDGGRLTRPLLRVKNNKVLITKNYFEDLKNGKLNWDDLLTNCNIENSVVEYIDPEEQALSMIAIKPSDTMNSNKDEIYKYTHCEIHPSTIFGILASCIPFPEHNQSPRNTYQSAQAKQAMGVYVTNYESRMDKTAYVLNYPARPMVDTRIMDMIHINKIPSGFNVIVAIMTHTGYNQEDSLLFNKGSIDRGLFQATIYHTEKDEDKQKINGDEEIRCKPDKSKTKGMKFANYDKVNSKGVIPENTLVENRDIIISKIMPIKENRNDHTKLIKYEDQSRIYRTDEETYIDKNYIDRNGDGYNFAKVRIRAVRKPVIGDKFSSRSGQKGTIGNIIPEEDMPFTKDGIKPDIILNPHAIPSRMTIAHLKETVLAKVLLELGLFGDGTSFGDLDIKTICDELVKSGYEGHGNELLYNGLTGEQIECSIFIGPVFYQRLKHMVTDKQHSRSIGPMVNLTRQPAEGRSRDGGLRFGEMERDTTVAHGAARFTKERLYDVSDKYSVYSCKKCGMIASYNDKTHIHRCRTCDNRTDFAYVQIPYACKLLFQELITMNIAPRIITEN
jgi:DNA-directed RNA polymerase beta subunit/intein/homing endonuclease